MAKLTTCGTCGHQVSSTATQCPNCGAKIKRSSPILNIIVGIIEAPFFQEPRTQFDFDIAGLEWKH